jgi:hypothetical protein
MKTSHATLLNDRFQTVSNRRADPSASVLIVPGQKQTNSAVSSDTPRWAARPTVRAVVRVSVLAIIFVGGYFTGFVRANGEWRDALGFDVTSYLETLRESQLVADVKNMAIGLPSPDSIKLRFPLTPLQERLAARQANPDLSWLPLNLDGTILRYYSDVYKLFLPADEMAIHGLTPATLIKKLQGDASRADDPSTVVFTVELIRLTEQSKQEFRQKAAHYRELNRRVDELFAFDKRVISFTNDDIRNGIDGLKDQEKRNVLTNIVTCAQGIAPLSGIPEGYAAYTEWKLEDYDMMSAPVLVYALPRRPWKESELEDLSDEVDATTIGR